MAEKVKVGRFADVPRNGGIAVAAGGRQVAVFNVDGKLYAIDNTCPHRGGPLAEGFLQGTKVACPWHGWGFDVCTGASTMNATIKQACYPVSVEGDEVYVTV